MLLFRLKFIITLFFPLFITAQDVHPNTIRTQIYKAIIDDLNTINKHLPLKQIDVDVTINTFENIDFNSVGIDLINPHYANDKSFCNFIAVSKCVNKIEIDKFSLSKILVNHKDEEYVNYFGIYAPLDHWYELVNHSLKIALLKEKPLKTSVIIPVKNVYFNKGEVVNRTFFYEIILDQDFKITSKKKINFL